MVEFRRHVARAGGFVGVALLCACAITPPPPQPHAGFEKKLIEWTAGHAVTAGHGSADHRRRGRTLGAGSRGDDAGVGREALAPVRQEPRRPLPAPGAARLRGQPGDRGRRRPQPEHHPDQREAAAEARGREQRRRRPPSSSAWPPSPTRPSPPSRTSPRPPSRCGRQGAEAPDVHSVFVADFSPRQVMLEVTVAELNRTAMEEHGIDFRRIGTEFVTAFFLGGGTIPTGRPFPSAAAPAAQPEQHRAPVRLPAPEAGHHRVHQAAPDRGAGDRHGAAEARRDERSERRLPGRRRDPDPHRVGLRSRRAVQALRHPGQLLAATSPTRATSS